MIGRKVAALLLGVTLIGSVVGCSSSSKDTAATTTTTISKEATAWAAKWDGLVVTNSGYGQWFGLPGNVLLAFSAK